VHKSPIPTLVFTSLITVARYLSPNQQITATKHHADRSNNPLFSLLPLPPHREKRKEVRAIVVLPFQSGTLHKVARMARPHSSWYPVFIGLWGRGIVATATTMSKARWTFLQASALLLAAPAIAHGREAAITGCTPEAFADTMATTAEPACMAPSRASSTFAVALDDAPAVISFSRAVTLTGDRPVSFRRSSLTGGETTLALSSRGRAFDPVRQLGGPGAAPQTAIISASGSFRPQFAPLSRTTVTSSFGYRRHPVLGYGRLHAGLDLAARYGSPIHASSDGVVSAANWRGGYGLTVSLLHGGGIETRYAHMSQVAVYPGQRVKAGEVIGFVGSTGLSTGPHLHYEVRYLGRPVDPRSVVKR